MTMRLPSGVEHPDADHSVDSPEYVEIDVADAQGATVTVLHRPAPDGVVSAASDARRSEVIRLASPAAALAAALIALSVSRLLPIEAAPQAVIGHIAVAASFPLAVALLGGYRRGAATTTATVTAGIAVTALAGALAGASVQPERLTTRLAVFAAVLAVLHISWVVAWSRIRRFPRVAELDRLPTAVVGAADRDSLRQVLGAVEREVSPVAVIDPRASVSGEPLGQTVDRVLRESHAECLLVLEGSVPGEDLDALRRVARLRGAEMRLLMGVPETFAGALRVRAVAGRAIVTVPKATFTGSAAVAKRALDLVVGSLAAVISMPVMLVIAVAIKVSSPGPVLFWQERVGKDGRRFRIVKFRTMEHRTDAVTDSTRPFFKMQDDPRLTRVGRVIRALSLDELPQLWNVLKGEMSLVGPRPLPREQVLAHPELLGPRHEVAPGMTGWWQVNGRSDLPAEEAVAYDRFYIENWSIGLDLRIILKTIAVLVTRRGAY